MKNLLTAIYLVIFSSLLCLIVWGLIFHSAVTVVVILGMPIGTMFFVLLHSLASLATITTMKWFNNNQTKRWMPKFVRSLYWSDY